LSVALLGQHEVPKVIVTAAAMVVLEVLLLGFFGSLQAAREAGADLRARLSDDGVTQVAWHAFDEHPNAADFLEYASYVGGKSRGWTRYTTLVLYPLPGLAFVAWVVWGLWRPGVLAAALDPSWLEAVYNADTILVFCVLWCAAVFIRRRWELFRTGT
jgi:hypothetical protein